MKIAIIGYGKMGKLIEQLANEKGHEVVSIIDPSIENSGITKQSLSNVDVCIEFTHPDSVMENIKKTLELGKNIVVGTTGWHSNIDVVKQLVEKSNSGLLHASNFSIGMNLFMKTLENAASLFLSNETYDIAGMEAHHNQKFDSPSGSAKEIQSIISKASGRSIDKIPFSSLRCGAIPGTTTIYFDSVADTITLTHQARNRSGFANGAIISAEWLQGKKGVFTMEDLLCLN